MMSLLISGFLLGLAYAAPIGAQNLFVVSQSLRLGNPKSLLLAAVVALMDVSLAIACVMGLGWLLKDQQPLRIALGFFGGIYLIFLAIDAVRSLASSNALELSRTELNWKQLVIKAFFLTWLNPHAIIDGSAVLGSSSAGLDLPSKILFLIGVAAASTLWFSTLSTISASFQNNKSQIFVNGIKVFSAITILYFGVVAISSSIAELVNT